MATRAKEPQPGKERKGVTSPSTQNQRKTPLTSRQPSLTKPSTSSSTSSVKNAARPSTGSSSSSSTNKQTSVKRVSSTDSLSTRQPNTLARRNSLDKQPTTLARRNSLDKPPPRRNSLDRPLPASSPKTRVSPAPKERTFRSSSTFTPRTTTRPPSSSDRLSKLPAAGSKDSQPRMISTSVRKSSTFNGRKQQDRAAIISKGALRRNPAPPTSEVCGSPLSLGIPLPETDEDLCASMTEADETMLNAGSSNEFDELDIGVDVSPKVEEKEPDEVVHEPKIVDEPSIDPKPVDQDETVSDDSQEQETIASNDSQTEEHGEAETGAPAADHDDLEKVEDGQASEFSNDHHQTAEEEKEADNITEKHEHVLKQDDAEKREAEVAATSTKPEVVVGQRDAAAVSNNVIEETANKLREQRKNRVRALAGAFEQVISLQDK